MYKKAIDLLIGMGDVEKAKLVVELAKQHPSIFIKLVEGKGAKEDKLDEELVSIVNALNAGRRVDAAKGIREYWGHDFHDSLDIAKVYDGYKDILLSPAQTDTLNKIKHVAKVLKG